MSSLSLLITLILLGIVSLIFLKEKIFIGTRILLTIAACFLFFGIFGNILWERLRISTDIAYLGNISLSDGDAQISQLVLFGVSFGILIGTVIENIRAEKNVEKNLNVQEGNLLNLTVKFTRTQIRLILLSGVLLLSLYLLGTGSTFWYSKEYLYISGNVFAYKIANSFIVAWCMLSAFIFYSSKQKQTIFLPLLNLIFFLLYFGEGSRQSLIIFIAWFLALAGKFSLKLKLIFVLPIFYVLIYLFQVTQLARSQALGISQIPNLISLLNFFDTQMFFLTFRRLFQSLFNWWVTIPLSVDIAEPSLILRNLSPLIGAGSDAFNYSSEGVERLYPYWWNPASTAGQLFGVFGLIGIVIIYATFAFILSSAIRGLTFSDPKVLIAGFLVCGLFLIQTLFFLQYSVRVWARTAQFYLAAYAAFAFIRKRYSSKRNYVYFLMRKI